MDVLVGSDLKHTHAHTLKTGKKYQYWDKIAAAFKLLDVFFCCCFSFVFLYICFFLNIHENLLSLGLKNKKSGAQVKDGVTRSGAGLFGR